MRTDQEGTREELGSRLYDIPGDEETEGKYPIVGTGGYNRKGEKRNAQDEIYEGLIEYAEGVD